MRAVLVRARADLRARWRAWIGLALLVGVVGAVALTAAAGARRTQTAFGRLLAVSRAPDVIISKGNGLEGFDAEVAQLPEVAEAGPLALLPLAVVERSGQPNMALPPTLASIDGRVGYTIYRPNVLAGRMPDPDRETEILVSPKVAGQLGLKVGDHIVLAGTGANGAVGSRDSRRNEPRYTFTVTGVGVLVDSVAADTPSGIESALITPAWFRAHATDLDLDNLGFSGVVAQLRPGADLARLRREVDGLLGHHPEAGPNVFFSTYAERYAATRRAINPQVVALALFAAVAGGTGLMVVGQALSRRLAVAAGDHRTLTALGMSRAQLVAISLIPAAAVAVAGTAVAVGAAVLASPLTPLGPARAAEPHPGLAVNGAVLGLGAAAMVLLLGAWPMVPAWRAAAAAARPVSDIACTIGRSRAAGLAARSGASPSAAVGVRMALEPGGDEAALPLRAAVVGGGLAVTALVAAISFVANLGHLVSTAPLYGRTWDFSFDPAGGFTLLPVKTVMAALAGVRGVGAAAGGVYENVTIGDQSVTAVGLDDLKGHLFPTLLEGRAPSSADEIVLGSKTLARAHRSVGQTVDVQLPRGGRQMLIVGKAVFPRLGRGGFTPTGLGEGAATTVSALAPGGSYNFVLVRAAPGANHRALLGDGRRVANGLGCAPDECPSLKSEPVDIDNYARVRTTPMVLAALLGVLAVTTLGHALVSSVRRRRRDLAVLKTLGFVRRQVSASVAWQATTLVALALLAGIPLGLGIGRWGWVLFARQLGAGVQTVVPVTAVVVTVAGAIAVANLIASLPARAAARTRPAVVLRAE